MNTSNFKLTLCVFLTLLACNSEAVGWQDAASGAAQRIVDFNRDVRPILSDTCFKCHGPDEHDRQAGLRLDTESGVFDESSVVQRGDAEASDLYERIVSDDEDLLMPPPASGRVLTDQQKETLRLWIEQGAKWEKHWSLVPPNKPRLPKTNNPGWARNPIDHFVLKKLESMGLKPNEPANRQTLIRRVCFDLTGLPPSEALVDEFVKSSDEDWYERLVDRLFESQHHGEHMARYWLDAARYGDTHGLHLDNYREMWLYRDWVINAFNSNKSFKEFAFEQLAGDLLPNATEDQLIATGFNRAHITTAEGGSIAEEVYVRNVVDRVSTTGTVFMGLTVGCAQCHDHKFDPISQKEFYQLFAFFNNLDANPLDGNAKAHAPVLRKIDSAGKKKIAALEKQLADIKNEIKLKIATFNYKEPSTTEEPPAEVAVMKTFVWLDESLPAGAKQHDTWKFVADEGPIKPHSGKTYREATSPQFVQHHFTGATNPIRVHAGDVLFGYVYLDPKNPPSQLMLQFNNGNWEHRAYWGEDKISFGTNGTVSRIRLGDLPETGKWIRLEVPAEKVGFSNLARVNGMAFSQYGGTAYWDSAGVDSSLTQSTEQRSLKAWLADQRSVKGEGLPGPIKNLVNKSVETLTEAESQKLYDHFIANVHPDSSGMVMPLSKERDNVAGQLKKERESYPTTLIYREKAKVKDAYLLNRGEYDQRGEKVERRTPAALLGFPDSAPRDRLGLAQWLFDSDHPLTARVAVNRYWQQVFGNGIVATADDFGAQGTVPTNQALLDWLAVDFVENDWNVRRLMRMLVTSAAYQQNANVDAKRLTLDPANEYVSRGPRFRLDAEMLRDQALAVSGLLVKTVGGPSVKPPQPGGLWFAVGYSGSNTVRFKKDSGADKVHRRSLYTFWKRTSPPPQMSTFDAPTREACSVRRDRTNTPLQALLLMNDPQYVEAARYLAQRTLDKIFATGNDETGQNARLKFMFTTALGRQPTAKESKILTLSLNEHRAEFVQKPEEATKLISIGEVGVDTKYNPTELAAWTMVASLIMNMDEFVNKN